MLTVNAIGDACASGGQDKRRWNSWKRRIWQRYWVDNETAVKNVSQSLQNRREKKAVSQR